MNCRAAGNLLSQYLDGDLSPREASQIQAHLLACRSCAADLGRLTRAVSAMETEPGREDQVDLYPAFVARLESKPRRSWSLAFPKSRRLALAGIGMALLLCGSLIGSWLGGQRTLYISNPRSESPLLSSIAIAADNAQDRAGVDAPLFADPRLSPRIDVRSKGEPLQKVLDTLARRSKAQITAAPDIASQRVYLELRNMPIAGVLAELRQLFDLDWKITEGPSGRAYELIISDRVQRMADSVAEAQAFSEAETVVRAIKAAIDSRDPEPISKLPISGFNDLGGVLTEMQKDPSRKPSPSTADFFLMDDEAFSTVLAGQEYVRSFADMSDRQKEAFQVWWEYITSGTRDQTSSAAVPADARFRAKLDREATGNILLRMVFETDGTSHATGVGVFSPVYAQRNTNKLTVEDIQELYDTASRSNPGYADQRLAVKMGNGVYGDDAPPGHRKPTYTLAEMLDLIADRTNLQIVSDFFTVDQGQNRMLPIELTLGQLLAILDRDYNIAWALSENNVLHLVHRQWPLLRQTEPSGALVEKLDASIARNGRLNLDDLAALASLSEPQLQGTLSAVRNHSAVSDVGNIVVNLRPFLRLYSTLSPEQRRVAESKDGLPSARMTGDQRAFAVWAAYGVQSPADTTRKPFVLRISRLRGTYADVERMLAKVGNKQTVNAGGDGPSDFVIFRLSGGLDRVGAFSLPER